MALRIPKKRKDELMPGTLISCDSGMYIAFYEHRTDIIAHGENEMDAINNLRKMYKIVMKHEPAQKEDHEISLPPDAKTKQFFDHLATY